MKDSPAIVVVGSFVQDLVFLTPRFPRPGETVVGSFRTGPGGKGSNQAVAAARAGASVAYVGALGRDAFGQAARAFHASEGIAAHWVEKPDQATGSAAILVDREGQNQIVVALGANEHLRLEDFDAALLKKARVVVAQFETDLGLTHAVLAAARAAGATAVLNPAPMRPNLPAGLLAEVDVLVPNESEFAALVSTVPAAAELAARVTEGLALTESRLDALSFNDLHALARALGVPTVLLTLGSRGCLVSRPDGYTFIAAHHGINVVDTTGAGDAFVGGFAAGLLESEGDIVAAARFANTVAGLSVTKPGTAPAMPTRAEIEAFLKPPSGSPAA